MIHSCRKLWFSEEPERSLGFELSMFQDEIRILRLRKRQYSASRSCMADSFRRIRIPLINRGELEHTTRMLTDPVYAKQTIPRMKRISSPSPHGILSRL